MKKMYLVVMTQVLCILTILLATEVFSQETKSSSSRFSREAVEPTAGCCSDPDVKNYGNSLDFTSQPYGLEITTQFRNLGVLFGRGASPWAEPTIVRTDGSRPTRCINQGCLNGDPVFEGWEFFAFVDPVQNKWATVQKVGVDIGYCDVLISGFIAAYDKNGNLLEVKFNNQYGFQFLGIERQSSDISYVRTGDCINVGGSCQPDPNGTAINCVTFSTPITISDTLPDSIVVPPHPPLPAACRDGVDNDGDGCADYPSDLGCSSPDDNSEAEAGCYIPGTPSLTQLGIIGLMLVLLALATWVFFWRRRVVGVR